MAMFGYKGRQGANPFAQSRPMTDPTAQYNTALSPPQEAAFQQWRASLPPNLQNTADYDLRGAWLGSAQEAGNGHLPDTWKKPNHMTFSDGSIYANAQNPAGRWEENPFGGGWTYYASPSMTRYRDPSDLLNYFQAYEPGSKVVLPKGTK